jgi:CII-binding regulator of phage lambda lysogenization HflD
MKLDEADLIIIGELMERARQEATAPPHNQLIHLETQLKQSEKAVASLKAQLDQVKQEARAAELEACIEAVKTLTP